MTGHVQLLHLCEATSTGDRERAGRLTPVLQAVMLGQFGDNACTLGVIGRSGNHEDVGRFANHEDVDRRGYEAGY